QLLDINRRAEEMLGYSRVDLEGLSLKVLFPRPYRYRFWRLVARVRKTESVEEQELRFRRKDGSQFIGAVQARIAWFGNRRVVQGSFRDVTATVNLEIELRRHNRRLGLFNEIAHRVAEKHDLQATLEIILENVIESLAVSGGGIFLLHHQGTEMQLAIHRNIPTTVLNDLRLFKPGEGLAGKVAATGRPRLSTNLQNDHRRLSTSVAKDNWHAFLAVPLIAEETTLGVLFIFDRTDKVLSREDVRLMQAIGRQVGPLVKNAELIDELKWQQRLNEASTRELERSRSALRASLDQLEDTHRMLESLDQMKGTFLSLASHELRTPLTTITCGAELLQTLDGVSLDDNGHRALQAILSGSERLNEIVNDLLEAARLEANALYLARETFDPQPVVEELLDNARQTCAERNLTCRLQSFPSQAAVRGDAHHIGRALGRLLENAIKFTPKGGQIDIEGSILSQAEVNDRRTELKRFSETFFHHPLAAHYLVISVCDSGIGIDPTELVKIFDKFYEVGDISGHSSSRAEFGGKGVGLGLTLVKGVVEAHHGMAWADSRGTRNGSRFSIMLPLVEANGERYVQDEKPGDQNLSGRPVDV
ncbi:MAG: GAF domain-containing protein, partial [Deltaproteobacteria bacterium]|nr:GAF domain-containing protein [Deltaproteobacteria bacterium]